jgi:hypothetical protein
MATKPEDEKDPKRARVVLSKGCEVVRPGYLRLTGVAAKVMNRGEKSGNSSQVKRVSKTEPHYPSRVSRVNKTAAQINEQIELAGLIGLAGLATQSRK